MNCKSRESTARAATAAGHRIAHRDAKLRHRRAAAWRDLPLKHEAAAPAALLVRLEHNPRVQIIANDLFEQQRAKPVADLVEHVVRVAMEREAGAR